MWVEGLIRDPWDEESDDGDKMLREAGLVEQVHWACCECCEEKQMSCWVDKHCGTQKVGKNKP